MTEFSSMLKSVWEGQCPPEALADWIIQELPNHPTPLSGSYGYAEPVEWELLGESGLIELRVEQLEFECIKVVLYWKYPNDRVVEFFNSGDFHRRFPSWLSREIMEIKDEFGLGSEVAQDAPGEARSSEGQLAVEGEIVEPRANTSLGEGNGD